MRLQRQSIGKEARPPPCGGRGRGSMSAHLPARVCTAATGCCASAHGRVCAEGVARSGAQVAGFGAQAARGLMHGRPPHHEVGTKRAGLRAVEQALDVSRRGMFAAFGETFGQCSESGAMGVVTRGDTSVHGFSPLLRRRVHPAGRAKDASRINPYRKACSVRKQWVLRLVRSSRRCRENGARRSNLLDGGL